MALNLLDLPAEIRLKIYSHLFTEERIVIDAGNYSGPACLLPKHALPSRCAPQSAQLLRVSKLIYGEAAPFLYRGKTFIVSTHTFAGAMPIAVSDGNPWAKHVKELVWRLQCDFMKKCYFEDLTFSGADVSQFTILEFRCQAADWRNALCDEAFRQEKLVQGRERLLQYLKYLQDKAAAVNVKFTLSEDKSFLGKGQVWFRLDRSTRYQTLRYVRHFCEWHCICWTDVEKEQMRQ